MLKNPDQFRCGSFDPRGALGMGIANPLKTWSGITNSDQRAKAGPGLQIRANGVRSLPLVGMTSIFITMRTY
ncbi:MAG: hypothetical protein JWQ34_1514 [Mucilaginibacter sp.]|nr:hypothetical protein [Mucilaginibacter sp.]